MARSDAEKVEYAVGLLRDAHRAGRLSQAELDQHLRELGVEPEQPPATVTITAQVRGELGQLRGNDAPRAIEDALGELAEQAGLTVVEGSVRVQVDGAAPAPAAAPAAPGHTAWRAGGAEQRGRRVTISVGWDGGRIPAEGREIVEERLAELGRGYGVNLVPGSVAITNPGAGTVRIELLATGVEQIGTRQAEAERAIQEALTGLARRNGLAAPRPGSVRVQV